MKVFIVILAILAIGLGVALFKRHTEAVQEKQNDVKQIVRFSNEVVETRTKLDEQEKVNLQLNTNLNLTVQSLAAKSNESVRLANELEKTRAQAKADAEAAEAAHKAEMAKSQAKIDEMTRQIDGQTKQLTDLNSAIDGLSKQITDTERKLAASEGDREFLLKELKRLQAEKADLEKQFNDLAQLRSQISKLRDEMAVARRLQWIRDGLYGRTEQKGAEKLLLGITPAGSQAPPPGFDLNVELRQDGTTKVNPPATNRPAATNRPPVPPPAPK